MLNGLISSIVKNIISSCGKTCFKKLLIFLKTIKIKKTLVEKIENNILSKHGNDIFYNSLDAFLTRENFAKNIINYCFVPTGQHFNSLNNYNTYLTEKFIEENFGYVHFKSQVFQTLNVLSQIIFNVVNDYSDDQTARSVIAHMNEKIEGISDKIDELMIIVNKPEEDQNNRKLDLNNQTDINNYKLSLATYFINNSEYISRNIFSSEDSEQTAVECLKEDKRIILLGSPGCGKTYESLNVLQKCCLDSSFSTQIPVYIKLIEYGVAFDDILSCIKSSLFPYFGEIDKDTLTEQLKNNKFILILDGVDEILNSQHKVAFFSDINHLLSYTNAYYFITSRINPYQGNINNVKEYRIKDITHEQIRSEFHKHGVNITLANNYYTLFANPLFLQIGIKVLKNSGRSNIYNKSQLFSAYVEEVCYRRDKEKQIPISLEKNYYNILMNIGKLAFEKYENTHLTIMEFDEFFGINNSKFSSNNICDVFRIDIFNIEGKISFSHKQFKEYFAAYYLVKQYNIKQNKPLYTELMGNPIWQETMIFAAGLIDNIEDQNMFLDMLLKINLKTYISCVKHKNDLSEIYLNLSHEDYAEKYLTTLFESYTTILKTYFSNLINQFEPRPPKKLDTISNKKRCIVGNFSQDRKHLHYWFDWQNVSNSTIQILNESEIISEYKDFESRALAERRSISTHGVNLDNSNMLGDSARKIALDIIYSQIKEMINKNKFLGNDRIIYEKFYDSLRRIKELKNKTISEASTWIAASVNDVIKEYDSRQDELAGLTVNNVDMFELQQMANYLNNSGKTHEMLALPTADIERTGGCWLWEEYSQERVIERLKDFFLAKQLSFAEMVELNFPKMKEYFSLVLDSPYKYKVYVEFKDSQGWDSDPSITYYRISVRPDESIIPEVIVSDSPKNYHDDEIFREITECFLRNGKDPSSVSVTSTGFRFTLTSRKNGGNMPLTEAVYEDFEESFKSLFE